MKEKCKEKRNRKKEKGRSQDVRKRRKWCQEEGRPVGGGVGRCEGQSLFEKDWVLHGNKNACLS